MYQDHIHMLALNLMEPGFQHSQNAEKIHLWVYIDFSKIYVVCVSVSKYLHR